MRPSPQQKIVELLNLAPVQGDEPPIEAQTIESLPLESMVEAINEDKCNIIKHSLRYNNKIMQINN